MIRVFFSSRETRNAVNLTLLLFAAWQLLVALPDAGAIEHQWVGGASNRWHFVTSWNPAPAGPNGPDGNEVDVLFNTNFGGSASASLNQAPVTIRNITFDTAATEYEISGLSLQLALGGSIINTVDGQHQISSGLLGSELLTKTGIGTLTLSGNNSSLTGDTVIEAGTLILNNNSELLSANLVVGNSAGVNATFDVSSFAADYQIDSSQSLSGHGKGQGDFTNDGLVAPGGTGVIGDLEVMGNYDQTVDGTLEIEFSGVTTAGTDFDQLNVTGVPIVQLGGQLHLVRMGSFTPTADVDGFDFLTATTPIQPDRFDSIKLTNPVPNMAVELDYQLNRVRAEFVSIGSKILLDESCFTSGNCDWENDTIWDSGVEPTSTNPVILHNSGRVLASGTLFVQNSNAFAHTVMVSASAGNEMEMRLESPAKLSATHGVTIESGGTLSGNSTLIGNVVNDGGLLSPGEPNVRDNLTIDGDYEQSPAGMMHIDLHCCAVDQLTDTLRVSGDVKLGGHLELDYPVLVLDPAPGQKFTFLTTDGEISGIYDSVSTSGLPLVVTVEPGQVSAIMSGAFNFDLSDDGLVTEADIDDFLLALVNPDAWHDLHTPNPLTCGVGSNPLCGAAPQAPTLIQPVFLEGNPVPIWTPQTGGQQVVDLDDIAGMEAALAANGISVSIAAILGLPEPSCLILMLMSTLAILSKRPVHRLATTRR